MVEWGPLQAVSDVERLEYPEDVRGVYVIHEGADHAPCYVGKYTGAKGRWNTRLEVFIHANILEALQDFELQFGESEGMSADHLELILTSRFRNRGFPLYNVRNTTSTSTHEDSPELVHEGESSRVEAALSKPLAEPRSPTVGRSLGLDETVVAPAAIDRDGRDVTFTLRWGRVENIGDDASGLPLRKGLYIIYNTTQRTVYIGKAAGGLQARWSTRLAGLMNFGLCVDELFRDRGVRLYCAVLEGRAASRKRIETLEHAIYNDIVERGWVLTNRMEPTSSRQISNITIKNEFDDDVLGGILSRTIEIASESSHKRRRTDTP